MIIFHIFPLDLTFETNYSNKKTIQKHIGPIIVYQTWFRKIPENSLQERSRFNQIMLNWKVFVVCDCESFENKYGMLTP